MLMAEPAATPQPVDPGLFRFCLAFPIRYDDIDAQRHLNNVSYSVFMQQARLEYLQALGLWNGIDFEEIGMIMRETTCSYQSPAHLGETVRVWTRVSCLGTKSFHFEHRLETQRGEIATGRSAHICYDWAQLRSIAIPDAWRAAILAYEPALRAQEPESKLP
jgi:acyl-CoA thioester hydrolase